MSFEPPDPWILSRTSAHLGVVLLIHGLNNRPAVMRPLAEALAQSGYDTYTVTLTGHASNGDWPNTDYRAAWDADLGAAVHAARERFPQAPLFNVSYSLGATVTVSYLLTHPEAFKRMVLLSPAISLQLRSRLIRAFLPFAGLGGTLPSFAPAAYRAHSGTSLRAYRGLFEMIDELYSSGALPQLAAVGQIPTVCVLSGADALVSYSRLEQWIRESKLSAWNIQPLAPQPEDPSLPPHLILDRMSLGETEWRKLLGVIAGQLP